MTPPRSLGCDNICNREVLFVALAEPAAVFTPPTANGRQFVCFCVMDASPYTVEELSNFCENLLRLGCAYLSIWGPDCERIHDIMDEIVVGNNPPETDLGCVRTTWHAAESLEEALEFFLLWAKPDESYAPKRV